MNIGDVGVIAGILATLLGGAMAVVRLFFSQKERIENLEKQSVMDLLKQTQDKIDSINDLLGSVTLSLKGEIENLKKDVEDLRLIQTEHVTEMKTFGKAMLEVHRHFAGERAKVLESEKVEIGKDAWIIREKKSGGKNGE